MKDLGLLIFGVVTGAVTAAMIFTFFVRAPHVITTRLPPAHSTKSARVVKKILREVASVPESPTPTREAPVKPVAVTKAATKKVHKKVMPARHMASVAATSDVPTPVPSPAHTLPAPTFTAAFPDHLETNSATEIRIAWNKVEGAKGYSLIVEDVHGKLIKKYSTTRTDTAVQIPAPETGEGISYSLRVVAVNPGDIEGEKGEPRKMKVMRRNSALAPSLKQITIEE